MVSALAWPQLVAAGFLQTVVKKGVSACPPNFGGQASWFYLMPTVQSNSVPITRLKRRRDFVSITRRGQKWATPGLVLQSHRRKDAETTSRDGIRVGFTVTKKVGNAVIRNRARRRYPDRRRWRPSGVPRSESTAGRRPVRPGAGSWYRRLRCDRSLHGPPSRSRACPGRRGP